MVMVFVLAGVTGLMSAFVQHPLGAAPVLAAMISAVLFLRRRDVLLVGLLSVLVRDAILGFSVFTVVRVAAMLAVAGALRLARVKPTLGSAALGLLIAAPVYHLTLIVGDWATQFCATEPRTLSGLIATLQSSLPYVQRSLVTEAFFGAALLGVYVLAGRALHSRLEAHS